MRLEWFYGEAPIPIAVDHATLDSSLFVDAAGRRFTVSCALSDPTSMRAPLRPTRAEAQARFGNHRLFAGEADGLKVDLPVASGQERRHELDI